eukprot:gnl/Dysnectes_brevis/1881_a2162_812.p1 GENE.gnl/Dysnectes_brevis/1881_a2162_812~~gnl/Dysnectes_brevis/1881_a2162_812.p1  ORF type:complete len:441 (-),score=53.61 gnl/Dysnectes_brevis/1881_a2162_812:783-2105(-)
MGRKKLDLKMYLKRKTKWRIFLTRHMMLPGCELNKVIYRTQSLFPSEHKWFRRLYPTERSANAVLNHLPRIIIELTNEDDEALIFSQHDPLEQCKCRICRNFKHFGGFIIDQFVKPVEQGTDFKHAHDRHCFTSCTEHTMLMLAEHQARVYVQQQQKAREREPERQIQLPNPSGITAPTAGADTTPAPARARPHERRTRHHASLVFRAIVMDTARRSVQNAAVSRASIARDVLGDPDLKFPILPVIKGLHLLRVPPKSMISRTPSHSSLPATSLSRRPPFPLSRPVGLGIVERCHVKYGTSTVDPPFIQQYNSNEVLRRVTAELQRRERPRLLDTPSSIMAEMMKSGCAELLVSLSAVTLCGEVPMNNNKRLLPPLVTCLPIAQHLRGLAMQFRRHGGAWSDEGLKAMRVGDGEIEIVRWMQLQKIERMCLYIMRGSELF